MLPVISNFLSRILPARQALASPAPDTAASSRQPLQAVGISDFLSLDIPPREMLLAPILPERSLAMLYAPRGLGKSWLALSIGLTVASGQPLLRWTAPRKRNVLYIDGEMPLVSLQERLKAISACSGCDIPNNAFRILAADQIEGGINLSAVEGQRSLDPLLKDIDLLKRERCLGPDSKLVAKVAAKGPVCVAGASCRNEWAAKRHIAAGGCLGYGDRSTAT